MSNYNFLVYLCVSILLLGCNSSKKPEIEIEIPSEKEQPVDNVNSPYDSSSAEAVVAE